jgi:ABC-type multidrug transport system ATPase subunit
MRYAIQAQDLTKTFGKFTAVNAISFDVKQGEVFGFPRRQWRREKPPPLKC